MSTRSRGGGGGVMRHTDMYLGDYVLRNSAGEAVDRASGLGDLPSLFGRHMALGGTVSQDRISDLSSALPIDEAHPLGEGSFGIAYATDYNGRKLVIKKSKVLDENAKQDAHHEAEIAQRLLEGPTAVRLFAAGKPVERLTREEGRLVAAELAIMQHHPGYFNIHKIVHLDDVSMSIVSEVCENDLRHLKKNERELGLDLQLTQAGVPHDWAQLSRQIVNGINYMHFMGVAHLDIKLDNIFYQREGSGFRCFISDFGMSTLETHARGIQGTMIMMAPELFAGGQYSTPLADKYSVAMTLLDLLRLKQPWNVFVSPPANIPSNDPNYYAEWGKLIRKHAIELSAWLVAWNNTRLIHDLATLIRPTGSLAERQALYSNLTVQLGAHEGTPIDFGTLHTSEHVPEPTIRSLPLEDAPLHHRPEPQPPFYSAAASPRISGAYSHGRKRPLSPSTYVRADRMPRNPSRSLISAAVGGGLPPAIMGRLPYYANRRYGGYYGGGGYGFGARSSYEQDDIDPYHHRSHLLEYPHYRDTRDHEHGSYYAEHPFHPSHLWQHHPSVPSPITYAPPPPHLLPVAPHLSPLTHLVAPHPSHPASQAATVAA